MGFRIASEKLFRIASDLGVCDSNRIAHCGCIARFGPLSSGHWTHKWQHFGVTLKLPLFVALLTYS